MSQALEYLLAERGRSCCRCSTWKRWEEFPRDRSRSTGRSPRCKACAAEIAKEHADRLRARETVTVEEGHVCPACSTWKRRDEFSPDRARVGGLYSYCRSCAASARRE